MKKCPKCGRECDNNANFCVKCAYSFENERRSTEEKIYGSSEPPHGSGRAKRSEPRKKAGKMFGNIKGKDKMTSSSPAGKRQWKEDGKSLGPLLSGIFAVIAIIGIAIFFFISYRNQALNDQERINQYVEDIRVIADREENDYLDEVKDSIPGKEAYDQALEVQKTDDSDEEKLAALKSIYDTLKKGDQKLIDKQTESLNKIYDQVKGKYKEGENARFLITGEEERFQELDKKYATNLKEYRFNKAEINLNDYKTMLSNMSKFEESPGNYSAKTILLEDEFMPSVMDFSVSAKSYGADLDASHFVIAEKIGDRKAQYCDVTDVEVKKNKKMVDYQVHFKTKDSDNYSDKRGYILCVRNAKGDNGFQAQGGTLPELMVQKSVGEFMKDFAKAFNSDSERHEYDALAEFINDDDVEDEYRARVTDEDIIREGITNIDKNFKEFKIKDGGHSTMTTTLSYTVGRYRSWGEVSGIEPERSFVRNTYEFRYFNGDEYIIFKDGSGELCAQVLNQTSFQVKESFVQTETFSYTMTNTSISKITDHSKGDATITDVEGLAPLDNGNRYTESDLRYMFNDVYEETDYDDEYDDELDPESAGN